VIRDVLLPIVATLISAVPELNNKVPTVAPAIRSPRENWAWELV